MCGGSVDGGRTPAGTPGLSPRVRGKLGRLAESGGAERSIPACAGEAIKTFITTSTREVYPRVCGGSFAIHLLTIVPGGLSPRVRGKRALAGIAGVSSGSIPACAGEAGEGDARPAAAAVYPRVCGGSAVAGAPLLNTNGLSPRVRGKLPAARNLSADRRSIPACAGEAMQRRHQRLLSKVYPRVCGGSLYQRGERGGGDGLSPRVRGKQPPPPQVRFLQGLSPRVRGKPMLVRLPRLRRWSIPACAGEARPRCRKRHSAQVYPRVCGGSKRHLLQPQAR